MQVIAFALLVVAGAPQLDHSLTERLTQDIEEHNTGEGTRVPVVVEMAPLC